MKYFIAVNIILLLLFTNSTAQLVVSKEDIDFNISNLGNAEVDQLYPLEYFIQHRMYEVLPKIEQYFWQQSCRNQKYFLNAMQHLNSTLTHQYALALFDSLSKPQYEKYDPNEKYDGIKCGDILDAKVDCIEVLYLIGDYSKVDEVFELIDREKESGVSHVDGISLLPYIINNRPDYKERAKQELMQAISTATDDYAIFSYSLTLTQAFNEEEIPEMVQIFKNSPSPQAKRAMLEFYFSNYEDKFDLNGLVKETLATETNSELRLFLAKILIRGFAEPNDYAFVKNYLQSEVNDTIKTLIQFEENSFKVPPPDSTKTISTMLDTLISYTNQCYEYKWIDNKGINNSLSKKLENAKKSFNKGNTNAAKNELEAYQNEVEAQRGKHITEDGYKFLFYYSGYIIERLQ